LNPTVATKSADLIMDTLEQRLSRLEDFPPLANPPAPASQLASGMPPAEYNHARLSWNWLGTCGKINYRADMTQTTVQFGQSLNNMVSFKHQHCDEFRGPLVWLAREAATFEIQSPAMMLHDQERLEDFKIFVDGVAIYRGRAVVQQIISGGATKISHVELDDAGFSDEYLATLTAAAEEGGSYLSVRALSY